MESEVSEPSLEKMTSIVKSLKNNRTPGKENINLKLKTGLLGTI